MSISGSRLRVVGLVAMAVVLVAAFLYSSAGLHAPNDFTMPTPIASQGAVEYHIGVRFPLEAAGQLTAPAQPTTTLSAPGRILFEKQKQLLTATLRDHDAFHESLHVRNKSDLIPAEGGSSVRNLIISTWRSGSSFLADVLVENPGTFLFYEPFMKLESLFGPSKPKLEMNFLNELFRCNLTKKDPLMKVLRERKWAAMANKQNWKTCKENKKTCLTTSYYSAACSLFPFVLIKTVRVFMNETLQLLQDDR